MDENTILYNDDTLPLLIRELASAIKRSNVHFEDVVLLGIMSKGYPLAQRLAKHLAKDFSLNIPVSAIDVGLYRDDLLNRSDYVTVQSPGLSIGVNGKHVILVDDVCFSGRTIRSALNAIMDYGRPTRVELAVLFDRPFRELPIQPNYVGDKVATKKEEYIEVKLTEIHGEDSVVKLSCEKP
jgi:pyrimidine operon attenuation protein/uracil phosphoribosyltransferase